MKRIFPYFVVLTTLLVMMSSVLEAGSARRRGTAGAQELLIPVGSVGTALGGAATAMISGIEAAYWNPAGVANISGNGEVIVSHMKYIADIDVSYLAVASKLGRAGTLGLSMTTLNFGDIPITTTDMPDGTGEYFSPRFFVIGALYSKKMTDRIFFGTKLNLVSEQVINTSATGVTLDAGVQYSAGEDGFKMGVVLKNLGPDMKFNGSDLEQQVVLPGTEPGTRQEPLRVPLSGFEVPTQMELGIAYPLKVGDMLKLTLGGSFVNDNFNFDQYRFGAELEVVKMAYLRGCLTIAENPENNKFVFNNEDYMWGPGIGGGFKIPVGGNASLMIDYAYRVTAYFDNNQWFSIRFGF